MIAPRVTAIVVTYNSRHSVARALRPLHEAAMSGLLRCLVVDNASADRTASFVRRHFPWCTVIETGVNLGFGRACNLGFGLTRTPYALLLNPDAALPRSALEQLVSFMDTHSRAGIGAPAVLEPGGRLQYAGGLPTPTRVVMDALGIDGADPDRRPIIPGQRPFRTTWLCGAILLLRRAMLDELGGFDSRYFLYFEETDLCRRAAASGWELWAVGESIGMHTNGMSARHHGAPMVHGCIAEHYFRSRFYYLQRHHGWPRAATAELLELGILAMKALPRALTGRSNHDLAVRLKAPILQPPSSGSRP